MLLDAIQTAAENIIVCCFGCMLLKCAKQAANTSSPGAIAHRYFQKASAPHSCIGSFRDRIMSAPMPTFHRDVLSRTASSSFSVKPLRSALARKRAETPSETLDNAIDRLAVCLM